MEMSRYLINDKSRRELTTQIIETIRGAQKYIKTGNFLFQDYAIIIELQDALRRGVAVFILSNTPELERDAAKSADGDKINMHLTNLKRLHREGAHCRSLDDLHAKFIIADGNRGIMMSANFAPTSLDNNIETGLLLDSVELKELEYTFDILYINSDTYLQESDERHQSIRAESPVSRSAFDSTHITSRLRLTVAQNGDADADSRRATNLRYCEVHSIYDEIIGIINRASEYVYIVTWHFKALNLLPEFTEALKQAIDRGVWVYLYSNTEQPNYSRPESLRQIEYLESIGCKSKGDDNNHSKCVISESEGVVFTANIDGVHGLKTGFEVGCVLQGEELDTAREYVEQIIGN